MNIIKFLIVTQIMLLSDASKGSSNHFMLRRVKSAPDLRSAIRCDSELIQKQYKNVIVNYSKYEKEILTLQSLLYIITGIIIYMTK